MGNGGRWEGKIVVVEWLGCDVVLWSLLGRWWLEYSDANRAES